MDAALDGGVLGRQAERIPAERMQHVEPLQPLHPRDDVADDVVADVADVRVPRGVREHLEAVELRLRGVFGDLERAGVGPALLPFLVQFLRVIVRHCGSRRSDESLQDSSGRDLSTLPRGLIGGAPAELASQCAAPRRVSPAMAARRLRTCSARQVDDALTALGQRAGVVAAFGDEHDAALAQLVGRRAAGATSARRNPSVVIRMPASGSRSCASKPAETSISSRLELAAATGTTASR